ncbi:MAG: hypothetical protein ACKOEM_21490 [Planctomycetia bacterium]
MSDEKDPWASLADSLGAAPNRDASPPPAQRPPEKPRQAPRADAPKAAAPRTSPGWDDLDTSLGLPASRESARPAERRPVESRPAPPRASQEPAVERPRTSERREFGFDDGPREGNQPRGEGDQPRGEGDDRGGEGRPRRRRGRRGGRGRGGRGRREDGAIAPRRDDGPLHDADHEGAAAGDRLPPRADDFDDEPRSTDREAGAPPLDEEGRPRRRRRRRGRRGGRREGAAGERTGEPARDGAAPRPAAERTGDDLDDEPLPSGYGRSQASRQTESRDAGPRPEGGERRGRRRRRGRGDEAGRRPAAEASGESSRRRGRRSRRSSDGERTSSSSSLARRSRDDFAPVSRGYDEDDEGLEFLGLEEAGHDQPRREQRHVEEDDVLVESGLNAVRDVPSWVEAIGIVIAGNLDARSRPRADRGDDDRRRRDR